MSLEQAALPDDRASFPALERQRSDSSEAPLSETLWDIRWKDHLPRTVTADGVTAVLSSFTQALPFIQAHYAEIFHEDPTSSPFLTGKITSAKGRYYSRVGDFFEFRHRGNTVGLLIGTPLDWSSYYLRSAAVLPRYQGKKVIQRFFPILFEVLRGAGVERVEADTSPANMATLQLLTRLRFNVTGTLMSERWGGHVHLTKFLDDSSEDVFLRQFCSGVKYQLGARH